LQAGIILASGEDLRGELAGFELLVMKPFAFPRGISKRLGIVMARLTAGVAKAITSR
jgi:hypothetical protein